MEKWEERDARRNKIIENTVNAADRIILDGSDGSEEETNFLTMRVAEEFIRKALHPFKAKMLSKDIKED